MLAIGLVVDDAIVVLENIFRHIEEGLTPFQAALKGVREISFAVVAMTLTLTAVFAPLAFTPGRTGRLFGEFALTLAGAVLVSGFVALTLTPMMCSKLLRHNPAPNRFDRGMEALLVGLTGGYSRTLRWVLAHRWLVLLVMAASAGSAGGCSRTAKSELSPLEDRGVIIMPVRAPDGATLEFTARYLDAIDAIAATYPEFDRRFMFMGGGQVSHRHRGDAHRRLDRADAHDAGAGALAAAAHERAAGRRLPSRSRRRAWGRAFASGRSTSSILTSDSYDNLARVSQQFMAEMAENPGFVQPDSDLQLNKPEIFMDVDRARAADMGVSVESVARTVETMLGGRSVTRYKRDADQYDVMVQTEGRGRATPEDIERLFVRGRNDTMVPLSSLVKVREAVSPRELNHFNQRRSVSITANLAPDYSLGEALTFLDETAANVLPPATPPSSTASAASSARRRVRSAWSSCWRCCSSSWCWRRSSRASSTRS